MIIAENGYDVQVEIRLIDLYGKASTPRAGRVLASSPILARSFEDAVSAEAFMRRAWVANSELTRDDCCGPELKRRLDAWAEGTLRCEGLDGAVEAV